MSEPQVEVAGTVVEPSAEWELAWTDMAHGVAELTHGEERLTVLVEGDGTDWVVTLRGRRIPVTVRTWREGMLVDAERAARQHDGPLEMRATLPGLIVAVEVEAGSEVSAGQALLTIEAMKMQNEVRAPRDGTIGMLSIEAGQTVATGAPLLRLD